MTCFTADHHHFGHANIIKLCDRPFSDVAAMNEALIAMWNDRVQGNDTEYIVGELFFQCADAESILKRLGGEETAHPRQPRWLLNRQGPSGPLFSQCAERRSKGHQPVTFDEPVENDRCFKAERP